MERISFKEFEKAINHLEAYKLTLEKENDKFWEAQLTTSGNYLTTPFLKYLVEYNLNIEFRNDKIIIDNI